MNGYLAFLNGIKPAYLATHMHEQKEIDHLKSLGYPHIFVDHDYGGSTIFFANEKLKQQYIKDIDGLKLFSKEEIILTGQYLGYPPIACKFFADYMEYKTEELKQKKAGFEYYDIVFVGSIDDAEEIAKWLWKNVKAPPKEVKVKYKQEIRLIKPTIHKISINT